MVTVLGESGPNHSFSYIVGDIRSILWPDHGLTQLFDNVMKENWTEGLHEYLGGHIKAKEESAMVL